MTSPFPAPAASRVLSKRDLTPPASGGTLAAMTAADIIHQIETLPAPEQEEVVRFAIRLGFRRHLTPPELGDLSARLAATGDTVEAAALREEIVQGFYGAPAHA